MCLSGIPKLMGSHSPNQCQKHDLVVLINFFKSPEQRPFDPWIHVHVLMVGRLSWEIVDLCS